MAANSDRDVVNLFYGFLSGSDNVPDYFRGKEITDYLQKAKHIMDIAQNNEKAIQLSV